MSNKVKDRLRKLALQMTHEERVELDNALERLYLKLGGVLISTEKACDKIMDDIPDDKLREIVRRIKLKKKREVLVPIEA